MEKQKEATKEIVHSKKKDFSVKKKSRLRFSFSAATSGFTHRVILFLV